MTPTRFLTTPDGVDLALLDDPSDPRPPLVVAHGAGSSGWFVVDAFADPVDHDGWRLVAYDLRGHGASTALPDPADHTLDHHVADLACVVADVGATVVAGVSLGGMAAVRLAAAGSHDLRAVGAALPAWTGRAAAGEGPHAAIAAAVAEHGVVALIAQIEGDGMLQPWLRDVLLRDYRRHDPASLRAALLALDGGDAPTASELAALTVPLGLVSWPDDPGHPDTVADAWATHAPRAVHVRTSIAAVQPDRAVLGRALLGALHARRSR